MIANIVGKNFVKGVSKTTNEPYLACNCCFKRKPYAVEGYTNGSVVAFSEFVKYTSGSDLEKRLHEIPIGSEVDIVYITRGRYQVVADIIPSK